jgi:hypothetical protein
MVLSINFFKIARNYLKTRTRKLTTDERKDFVQKMAGNSIMRNVILCITLGFVGAVGIVVLFFVSLNGGF